MSLPFPLSATSSARRQAVMDVKIQEVNRDILAMHESLNETNAKVEALSKAFEAHKGEVDKRFDGVEKALSDLTDMVRELVVLMKAAHK